MVQPCIWFKEEPSQFSMGKTAQSVPSWRNYIQGLMNFWNSYSPALEQGTLGDMRKNTRTTSQNWFPGPALSKLFLRSCLDEAICLEYGYKSSPVWIALSACLQTEQNELGVQLSRVDCLKNRQGQVLRCGCCDCIEYHTMLCYGWQWWFQMTCHPWIKLIRHRLL